MNYAILKFLDCSKKLVQAYQEKNWAEVVEHAGHLISGVAELWKLLATPTFASTTPENAEAFVLSDAEYEDLENVCHELEKTKQELEQLSGDNHEQLVAASTAVDPRLIIVIIQAAIELYKIVKKKLDE